MYLKPQGPWARGVPQSSALREPPIANFKMSNVFSMLKNIYFYIKLKKFVSFSVNFSNVPETPGVPPIALHLKEAPNANFAVSNAFLMLKNLYFDIKLKKFV